MPDLKWRGLRPFLMKLHLYLSLGLGGLVALTALSGAPLVWRDNVDRALNPDRYAITGSNIAQSAATYLARAKAAAGPNQLPVELRYPEEPGWPLQVTTRGKPVNGKPAGSLIVLLDPPTGNPLGVVGVSSSFVGVLHNFHHMLNAPQISGRQIVGWIGVALLILSLSGLYLWLPRNGALIAALRWRRAPTTITNLHHLLGFWISMPLAVVSLTGIYLAFPATAFSLMSAVAPVSAPMRHGYGALPLQETKRDADQVLGLALELSPGATPVSLSPPIVGHDAHEGHARAFWKVRLARPDAADMSSYEVDDNSGDVQLTPAPLAGDRAVAWINWIHEGRRGGPVWAFLVFLTGVFPPIFLVTGVIMWLRRRGARKRTLTATKASARPSPAA